MIIIKIITLYFIHISHTDDFPLNGYPTSVLLEKKVYKWICQGERLNKVEESHTLATAWSRGTHYMEFMMMMTGRRPERLMIDCVSEEKA